MGHEEVNAEELENNPSEEGTLEQAEAEPTQTTETVEETPEDPLASLPEEQREALIRAAQARFTPAQQQRAEEARLAKEEARIAKEEARFEREQRLAYTQKMEELQGKQPKQEEVPEDPEPEYLMDPIAHNRWVARQENKDLRKELAQIKQRFDEEHATRTQERNKQRLESDWAKLESDYPDMKDQTSDVAREFDKYVSSKDARAQSRVKLYRDGLIDLDELFRLALGPKAQAAAETKVKQDLVRKANAQVAGGKSSAPPRTKYASVDDAIAEAIREATKG